MYVPIGKEKSHVAPLQARKWYTAANTAAWPRARIEEKRNEESPRKNHPDISVSRLGARFWAYPRMSARPKPEPHRRRGRETALIPGSLWVPFIGEQPPRLVRAC